MDALSLDLCEVLHEQLGAHEAGYVASVRLSLTNQLFKHMGAKLPDLGDDRCELSGTALRHVLCAKSSLKMAVFDIRRREIVHIPSDPAMLSFNFIEKPSPSSRFLAQERRVVWCPPGSGGVRLSRDEVRFPEDRDELAALVKRPLETFSLSPKDIALAGAKDSIGILTSSRRSKSVPFPWQGLVDRVAADLAAPINSGLRRLVVVDVPAPAPVVVRSLFLTHLVELSLRNVTIDAAEVCALCPLSDGLWLLDLSGGARVNETAALALARLVQRWRFSRNDGAIRRLVLDHVGIDEAALCKLVFAASMPEALEWDMVDDGAYITVGGTSGAANIFLSCSDCNLAQWESAFAKAATMEDLVPVPMVRLKLNDCVAVSPQRKKKRRVAVVAPPPQALLPPAMPLTSSYTNATRERDRYMMQWFDYSCKSCGVVWRKHCVTISYRQTAVSECLKGKRACDARPEYTRMMDGEDFITDKHMIGNGGKDLTPDKDDILAAEKLGLLVALDPDTKTPLYFRPDPARAVPAKIRVTDAELAALGPHQV